MNLHLKRQFTIKGQTATSMAPAVMCTDAITVYCITRKAWSIQRHPANHPSNKGAST